MTVEMPTDENPVVVVEGDCLDVLRAMPDGCVDAVVTDPPYPQEFWPSVQGAVMELPRLMRDGAEAVLMVGQHMLPQVLKWAESAGLRYWWTCGMLQHCSTKMLGKRVAVYWKPALWFIKGKKRVRPDMPMDMLKGNRPDKQEHPWEQGVRWFEHWCGRCCQPGDTILDPFAGSGTTGVAAIAEGRKAILVEKEPKYAAICRRRVAEAMGMGEGSLLKTLSAPSLFGESS